MIVTRREIVAKDDTDATQLLVSVLDAEDEGRHVSLSASNTPVYLSWSDLRTFAHALIELADSEDPQPFGDRGELLGVQESGAWARIQPGVDSVLILETTGRAVEFRRVDAHD